MEGHDFKVVVTLHLRRQADMFRASARWAEEPRVYGLQCRGRELPAG